MMCHDRESLSSFPCFDQVPHPEIRDGNESEINGVFFLLSLPAGQSGERRQPLERGGIITEKTLCLAVHWERGKGLSERVSFPIR